MWVSAANTLLYVMIYLSHLLSKNPPHCLAVTEMFERATTLQLIYLLIWIPCIA